jgi:hypothetical protein
MEELTTLKTKTNKINYATTPISFYKFVCEDENVVSNYVGHTANFTRRKSEHKKDCNNEKSKNHHLKVYQTIRENGGWNNWRMIEIESQLCESKKHAVRLEQELIDQYKAELNMIKAFREETIQEYKKKYYAENKNKILEKNKEYYLKNKEEVIEKQKQYVLNNIEKVQEKKHQHYLDNKEYYATKSKQYAENNREKLSQYYKQRYLRKKAEKEN